MSDTSIKQRLQDIRTETATLETTTNTLDERLATVEKRLSSVEPLFKSAEDFLNNSFPVIEQVVEDIKKYKETSQSASQDAQAVIVQLTQSIASFADAEKHILGEIQPDGSKKGGLREAIGDMLQQAKITREEETEEYIKLKQKIEGLLPGATSVGLAEAFKIQKDTYALAGMLWPFIFIVAIGLLMVIGYQSFAEVSTSITLKSAAIKFLAHLPFYLGAVWLASFASRRQSQNKRLQEEYAHKETVSRSLEGYKREIGEIKASTEVVPQLLKAAVSILAFNPSDTLDKSHGDDKSPLASFVDKFAGKKEEPASH